MLGLDITGRIVVTQKYLCPRALLKTEVAYELILVSLQLSEVSQYDDIVYQPDLEVYRSTAHRNHHLQFDA
jgi:hypothetical protein